MYLIPLILPALAALPLLTKIGLGAAAAQGVMGVMQALTSGARKREREVEKLAGQSPTDSGSRELEGFYNEALRRYQQSPYQSAEFVMGKNLAERGQATALQALTQRNQGLAGAARSESINKNKIYQLLREEEMKRRQDFGILGQAGRQLAQRKLTQFDINQMTPYNRKFGLAQMKAQAANERKNAGIQMLGGALSNAASIGMASAMGGEGVGKTPPIPVTEIVMPRTTRLGEYQAEYNPYFEVGKGIPPVMPKPTKYLSGIKIPYRAMTKKSGFR